MFFHLGAAPGVSLQDTTGTKVINHNINRLQVIQFESDTRCRILKPFFSPKNIKMNEEPDLSVRLTVDVVNEARRPRYVIHLVLLFICFLYLYATSSHECFKICFFSEDHRKRLYTLPELPVDV